jgi:protein-tyrosine kinase
MQSNIQSLQHKSLNPRSIGAILVDAGKLSAADAEKIIREQKQSNLRFGDAAFKLGLLNQDDIQFALARQFDYPYLDQRDKSISEEVVAAFNPFLPIVEQLRALRTQLMLRWFDVDASHKSLAITSPSKGDGRSYVAANLAVVFSQLGERTLLIDADLRNPRQHQLFKTSNAAGLSSVLSGRCAADDAVLKIPALLGLSVLPAGVAPPNPQEILSRDAFSEILARFSESYDVILIDTPAAGTNADAQTIASRAGAALVVTRMNLSSVATIQNLTRNLQNSKVTVVGSLLNGT